MIKKILSKIFGSSSKSKETQEKVQESGKRHVLSTDEGWVIVKDIKQKSTKTFSTKKDALREAKKVTKQKGLRLVVHRQDGTVQREHDYS